MHHQKRGTLFWHDEFVAQQVEHNTFNVGVPGSSPGEFTRRSQVIAIVFFCLFSPSGLLVKKRTISNIGHLTKRLGGDHTHTNE